MDAVKVDSLLLNHETNQTFRGYLRYDNIQELFALSLKRELFNISCFNVIGYQKIRPDSEFLLYYDALLCAHALLGPYASMQCFSNTFGCGPKKTFPKLGGPFVGWRLPENSPNCLQTSS